MIDQRPEDPYAGDRAGLMRLLVGAPRIVFDLDGTLYDTRDFERPALAAVVAWLRVRSGDPLDGLLPQLWARRETARHQKGLFDDLLAEYGLPVEWGRECAQRFHDYPGTELARSPSLKPELEALRSDGCRLALVSNGYPDLQRRKLSVLGVNELLDQCVICDPRRPEQLKPSAWAWNELRVWRSTCPATYVGDDPVDHAFANGGAARFVGFRFRSEGYAD